MPWQEGEKKAVEEEEDEFANVPEDLKKYLLSKVVSD